MKIKYVFNNLATGLLVMLLVVIFQPAAYAITVDGSVNDWGVTPGAFGNPAQWIPNTGIDFVEEDQNPAIDFLNPGWGGQNFDVEAVYFTSDDSKAYFSVITGFNLLTPPAGYTGGDLALDFNSDGTYEFGLETLGANAGKLYSITAANGWKQPTFTQSGPFAINHSKLGSSVFYIGLSEYAFGTTYAADKHYVLEMGIPLDYFGLFWDDSTLVNPKFTAHWTMSCGNDALDLHVDEKVVSTPEPMTAFMLLSGLGLGALRKFRKK